MTLRLRSLISPLPELVFRQNMAFRPTLQTQLPVRFSRFLNGHQSTGSNLLIQWPAGYPLAVASHRGDSGQCARFRTRSFLSFILTIHRRGGHALAVTSLSSDAAQTAESRSRLVKRKGRLDEVCVEKFPRYSRTMIQSWILQGKVIVDDKVVFKAGTPVSRTSNINITAQVPKFVCRAGYKLEAALEHFGYDVKDKVALDAGLSTGGFTDCLLQYGASFVYGVDVGYGQVAEKIRQEKRVCVMERTNLRYLADLPEMVDLVTLDLAFISILLVMPAVLAVMKPEATLITLIKPQFEASRSQVGSGGVVRDPEVHKEVVLKVVKGVEACGFKCEGWLQSPLKGADGNIEFLACFYRQPLD